MDFLELTVHSYVDILRLENSVSRCAPVIFKTVIMPTVVYSPQKVKFFNNNLKMYNLLMKSITVLLYHE